jgi:2-iminobutanoate/2-iminopropanoate deaminase
MTKPLGPYTPAVRAGDWIICSGQLGQRDGKLVDGLGAQTSQVIVNIETLLAEHGATLADVAKTLCFLVDFSNEVFAEFNTAYVAGFDGHRPARSTIGVAALPGGAAVEIEAWAYKPR